MTDKKTLREANNVVEIEGWVKDIRIKTYKHNGTESISGEVDIQIEENSVHTIRISSKKLKDDGTPNGLYKGFETVMNEYQSIEKHGFDNADKVRITTGKIGRNEYYGPDLQLRSFPQLSTNFINRVTDLSTFEPKAKFDVEIHILSVKEEKVKEEETGRAIIKGLIPGYRGKVIPFDVVISDKKAAEYAMNNFEKDNTIAVYGNIVNKTIVTKKMVEVGFGQPQEKITRTTVREFEVTGGSEPKDEDSKEYFSPQLIKKALKEREEYLNELKEKKEKNSKNGSNENQSRNYNNDAPIDISDDDLPF